MVPPVPSERITCRLETLEAVRRGKNLRVGQLISRSLKRRKFLISKRRNIGALSRNDQLRRIKAVPDRTRVRRRPVNKFTTLTKRTRRKSVATDSVSPIAYEKGTVVLSVVLSDQEGGQECPPSYSDRESSRWIVAASMASQSISTPRPGPEGAATCPSGPVRITSRMPYS